MNCPNCGSAVTTAKCEFCGTLVSGPPDSKNENNMGNAFTKGINAIGKEGAVTPGLKVISLLINLLLFPGVGTVLVGKINPGITQIILSIVGFLLTLTLIGAIIGIPMILTSWIWGIVSVVKVKAVERAE